MVPVLLTEALLLDDWLELRLVVLPLPTMVLETSVCEPMDVMESPPRPVPSSRPFSAALTAPATALCWAWAAAESSAPGAATPEGAVPHWLPAAY